MNNHSTIEKMKQMRMTGMAEAYYNNIQSANYHNYTIDQYIAMLVDQEWEHRQERKMNGLVVNAKFKHQSSIRDIDYSHPRNLDRNLFERLVSFDFIKHNENIIITGPTGSGKSYLAQALGVHACHMLFKTLYFNTARLMDEIKLSKLQGNYLSLLKKLQNAQLLILDDFGLTAIDQLQRQALLDIVEHKYDSVMEESLKIMVASTVYGFEDHLSTICATLSNLKYQVINSHIGTVKVNPRKSNLENCLQAVRECDTFLGIVRPFYGTGNIDETNIAFEEMKLAINMEIPYWFLVHRDVVYTRQLMKKMYYLNTEGEKIRNVKIEKSPVFDERTLEMYDFVIKEGKPISTRTGNWAQEFYRLDEALVYIKAQFEDKEFVRSIINPKKGEE